MKVSCLHGYFFFREDKPGEVALFNSRFDQDLSAQDDYYTFEPLVDAPIHSIAPLPYLGSPALFTFSGKPHEIFEINKLVYNFQLGLVVPIVSITQIVDIVRTPDIFISQGLILPGSVNKTFQRITGYNGFIDVDRLRFYYTEFFYETT